MTHTPTWSLQQVFDLYQLPLMDLLFKAQTIHRQHFNPNEIQASTLVNIQQGGCPEDCKWCAQSVHHNTKIDVYPLMKTDEVFHKAKQAKAMGASRVCLGAAWRKPTASQLGKVKEMIATIKSLDLEACVTLGQLSIEQAHDLKDAGLDYYNHNLESSPEYFAKMTTTRHYEDRLKTIHNVQTAGLKTCCGGIVGMGESIEDQMTLLMNLANLSPQPKSVPINNLTSVAGTPLEQQNQKPIGDINFIRLIAIARIMMPQSYIRLSCGRERLSDAAQALAFFAGGNSFFLGEKLLTVNNRDQIADKALLKSLGMQFDNQTTYIPTQVCVQHAEQ